MEPEEDQDLIALDILRRAAFRAQVHFGRVHQFEDLASEAWIVWWRRGRPRLHPTAVMWILLDASRVIYGRKGSRQYDERAETVTYDPLLNTHPIFGATIERPAAFIDLKRFLGKYDDWEFPEPLEDMPPEVLHALGWRKFRWEE